ncbi:MULTISPECIES: hypothetical protein [Streptomyces]|uniref:Regulatory protein n=1 Tax=Streptomyces poriferorum TaxID=2798799 RepID=A0ABY9II50_9ACTN|nr:MULTISPECIES: hypothetical protein [unclassified Streptomyces]MDP5315626.1 hypothetical protein [Streptomyces sp. Alt4]WLQ53997.1 hypothetical protein P8A19_00325 [Streptomyces sp. Alt2]WSI60645.1 hypothetical protein OG471_00350 [Streptomyces sp. NBC_01336]
MSANLAVPSVTADYAQRVADDLSANRGEQERVRSELDRLQDELVRLEESEQVLTKMQDVLGGAPKQTAKQGKSRRTAAVPAARRSNAKTAAGKEGAASGRRTPKKSASAKKPGEATWLELTTAYLGGQSEPRSAAEVSASLTEAHPERSVQVTVVRNALEQGVAQGLLERSKQGRSVFYSPADTVPAPSDS